MSRHVPALIALLLASFNAAPGMAQVELQFEDMGPLRIRDQFLPGMGYLALDPESADVLRVGDWQIDLVETVTNTFAHSASVRLALEDRASRQPVTIDFFRALVQTGTPSNYFQLDGEVYRTALSIRRGVAPRLQAGITLPILTFRGGHLDGSIEAFHSTFRLGQHGRKGSFRDLYRIYIRTPDMEIYREESAATSLGDISLSLKYDLRPGSGLTYLSVEGSLKLPTGPASDLIGSGSVDLGMQALFSKYYRRACIHGSAGVLVLGRHDLLDLPSQTLLAGMIGYEHAFLSSRSALIAQLTLSESPFKSLNLDELASMSNQISLGLKWAFNPRSVLFLALTENIAHFDNTADLGFHLGWTLRFGRRTHPGTPLPARLPADDWPGMPGIRRYADNLRR
jgi:hypothetical protein